MLTCSRFSPDGGQPLAAALGPTARLAHPGLVALTVALAAIPALVTLALGGKDLFVPLVLAGVVTGAAVGWAVDDPAADLLASMPIGAPVRTAVRVGTAALVAGAAFALVLAAVAVGPGLPQDVDHRLPEAAMAAATALATGLIGVRRGERAAGAGAVTTGLAGPAVVSALSSRFPQLPSVVAGHHNGRWWLLALPGVVVALHAGRDPARR